MFTSSPLTSVPTSVSKRTASSATRRTLSGRHRWSSYELVGVAAVALAAEQADFDEPPATAIKNGLAVDQTHGAENETVITHPVHDLDTPPDTPREMLQDSSATEDLTPKEQRRRHDEILGN